MRTKFQLIFFFGITCAFTSRAQETQYVNLPMFREGVVRVYEQVIDNGQAIVDPDANIDNRISSWKYQVSVVGEESVNGNACKKVLRQAIEQPVNYAAFDDEYAFFTEQSGIIRKFTEWPDESTPEFTDFLNFNVTKGDVLRIPYKYEPGIYNECYVAADEVICVKGRNYRRLTIENPSGPLNERDYWVEGIGSRNGVVLTPRVPVAPNMIVMHDPELREVYEDGELIFEYDDFTTENVVGAVNSIESDEATATTRIYDLQGRELRGEPAKGVYIVNGHKVVK